MAPPSRSNSNTPAIPTQSNGSNRSASRYQLDGSLGRWGLIAAAALARSLCVDAQTAKSASVPLIHMIGCWFEVQPKIARSVSSP